MVKKIKPSKQYPYGRYKLVIRTKNQKKEISIPDDNSYHYVQGEWLFPDPKMLEKKEADLKTRHSQKNNWTYFYEAIDYYVNHFYTGWGDSIIKNLRENIGHVDPSLIWRELQLYISSLKYSPATLNRHIAIAKTAVKKSYLAGYLEKDYLNKFPTYKENNIKYRTLDSNEIENLNNELPQYLRPLFYFAIRVPCRISELVNLRKEQYNPFTGLITIKHSKNGEERWLPVFEEFKEYLNNLHVDCPYIFYRVIEGKYKPLGYFKNGYIIPNIQKQWSAACKRAGIEGYNFHKTRQQAAMQMLYDGFNELETMTVGGWRSYNAFRRYVQADEIMLLKKLGKWYGDSAWKKRIAPTG